ncbi:hypothetical protein JCM9492_10950 [Aquifex pyrophilus]
MNWELLRQIFLEILNELLEEEEEKAEEFLQKLLETQDATILPTEFTSELISLLLSKIAQTVQVYSELTGKDLQSVVEEVVNEVYPDGLNLSQRLWKWDAETRQGIANIIALGARARRSAMAIAYEIESYLTLRGEFDNALREKWIEELRQALSLNVRSPKDRRRLERLLKRLERSLSRVKGERYTERKIFIQKLKKALEKENERLLRRSLEHFIRRETLSRIQRITATELANTFHKVQIRATEGDRHLVGYRWRLSRAHPKPDICDVYANVDFGLGRGVWPKEKVPRRKPHPHCLCFLVPIYKREKEQAGEPKWNLEPLAKQHKYLQALKELGYDLEKVIDLDTETGRYLREKDFLEKFGLDREEWREIKRALTDRKLRKLGEILGIGARSIYREGHLVKHPLREEYQKVVAIYRDLLGNERVLTEFYQRKMESPILPKRKTWQIPYREWGAKNLEKLLRDPDVILSDREEAYLYGKWHKGQLVVAVVGSDSFIIYTVYPLENAKEILEGKSERYRVIYRR